MMTPDKGNVKKACFSASWEPLTSETKGMGKFSNNLQELNKKRKEKQVDTRQKIDMKHKMSDCRRSMSMR